MQHVHTHNESNHVLITPPQVINQNINRTQRNVAAIAGAGCVAVGCTHTNQQSFPVLVRSGPHMHREEAVSRSAVW
jgi:3-oxoacyl-[acyl-carrier-protein] synthase III